MIFAKSAVPAGARISRGYYGDNGSSARLPAGTYTVRIVTSNSGGSASAETTLTITAR